MIPWKQWIGVLALGVVALGCGNSAAKDSASNPGKTSPVAKSDNSDEVAAPSAPTGEAKPTGALEVVAFKGGYGTDAYEKYASEFEKLNPGLKITVSGNPRVWEQLRPRLIANNAPDLMFPGWGMDQWALAQEGQIMTLDQALDSPAYDGKGKWRDTFEPNILKLCQKDGKTYMLPYYTMVHGWWYDPGVFAANGWTVPKTYPELLSLCEKIKAKGIAPITYQGQYPYYMVEGMLLPWTCSVGGIEAVQAMQNLDPGAWKSPAILQAAKMIQELNQKGFFQAGATGMSHTESQTQFLNGKAAMIPCGTWLYSEMKKVMPANAKMDFFLPPVVPGGKGDPTSVLIGIEPWMVPSGAKNPGAAVSFYKYMTSLPKAKQMVEDKGTLMSIKGSDQAKLPPVLVKPSQAVRNAKVLYANQFRQWYPAFEKEVEGALTSLLNKEITPEQFADRCEQAAEKTRQDSSIAKYKVAS